MMSVKERRAMVDMADFAASMFLYILAEYEDSSNPASSDPTRRPARIRTHTDIIKPNAEFRNFCHYVLRASRLSPSTIILSLRFLYQIVSNLRDKDKRLKEGSEKRFFIGILILADKVHNDVSFYDGSWAWLTGISLEKIHSIERQFLKFLNYRVFVRAEEYTEWLACLEDMARRHMPIQLSVVLKQQSISAASSIPPIDPTTTTEEPTPPVPKIVTEVVLPKSTVIQQDQGSDRRSDTASGSNLHPHPYLQKDGQSQRNEQSRYHTEDPTLKLTGGAANATAAAIVAGGGHSDRIAGAGYTSRAASAGARHSAGTATTPNIPRPTNPAYPGQHRHPSGSRIDRVAPSQGRTTAGGPTRASSTTSVALTGPSSTTSVAPTRPSSSTAAASSFSYRTQPHISTAGSRQQQQQSSTNTTLSQESTALPFSASGPLPSTSNPPYSCAQPQQPQQSRISSSSTPVHKAGQHSPGVRTLSKTGSSSVQQTMTRVANHRHQQQHQHQPRVAATVPSQCVSTGAVPAPHRGQQTRSALPPREQQYQQMQLWASSHNFCAPLPSTYHRHEQMRKLVIVF